MNETQIVAISAGVLAAIAALLWGWMFIQANLRDEKKTLQ